MRSDDDDENDEKLGIDEHVYLQRGVWGGARGVLDE